MGKSEFEEAYCGRGGKAVKESEERVYSFKLCKRVQLHRRRVCRRLPRPSVSEEVGMRRWTCSPWFLARARCPMQGKETHSPTRTRKIADKAVICLKGNLLGFLLYRLPKAFL